MLSPSRNSKAITSRIKTALEQAKFLLRGSETEIPKSVVDSLTFFANKNIWYKLSRNPVVKSCKEAKHKYQHVGQDLSFADELKTYKITFHNTNDIERIALVHCRADRNMDTEKVTVLLPELQRITSIEEYSTNSSQNVIVNPFNIHTNKDISVVQIVDIKLLAIKNLTSSIKVSAGHSDWIIEFHANELVIALREGYESCIVSDVADKPSTLNITKPKSIGIIAGNPPEAAWLLWKKVEGFIKEDMRGNFICDVSLPKVTMLSIPEIGLSMELAKYSKQLWTVLKKNIEDLINQNVEIIAIACHTMQYYSDDVKELCKNKGVEYVSIPDILCEWLKNSSIDNAALLGIGYSAQLGKWSGYNKLAKIIDIDKMPEPMLNRITTLAYDVKANVGRREFQKLERIIKDIDSENIIYLLFELSILAEHFSLSKNFHKHYIIDAVDIYAKALASKIMGKKVVEW